MPGKFGTLEERFWRHVHKTDSCWLWVGSKNQQGYGNISIGRVQGKSRCMLAPRLAWKIANGDIPEGLHVLHSCDNPPCVNPEHLWLGTQTDNNRDMRNKGRNPRPYAKLTESQVRDIRALYWESTEPVYYVPRLASEYGVTDDCIWSVVRFRDWRGI